MSDPIIRVENLVKKYIIGHQQENQRYMALRDVMANGVKGVVDRFRNPKFSSAAARSAIQNRKSFGP